MKISDANSPAIGFKACAACADVSTLVMPLAFSVAAVVTIIDTAITFEKAMPARVSARIRAKAEGACHHALISGVRAGLTRTSSASSAACQKNRYGEIVVPAIATRVVR